MSPVASRVGWPAAALTTTVAWAAAVVAGRAGLPDAASRVADATVLTAIAALGALIVTTRGGHRIGRLLLAGAGLWAAGSLPLELAVARLLDGDGSTLWVAVAVVAFAVRGAGFAVLITLVPLYFPTGTLPSPRWRLALRTAYAVLGLLVVGALVSPSPVDLRIDELRNPIGLRSELAEAPFLVGYLLMFVSGLAGFVAVARRWRRGDELVRQQIGWFVVGMVLPPVLVLFVASRGGAVSPWFYPLAVAVPSIAIGAAVLQHRLYDVPLIVNRTLLYGLLTASVVALYVLVVAGVGAMIGERGSRWLSFVAAGVVAVAFQPIRAGLQRGVNRVAYGSWEEPYDVLEAVGGRLAASSAPGSVLADVADTLCEGLRLRYVGVLDDAGDVLGASGDATVADIRDVPLVHHGETVGVLRVAGLPGRRARDARLLETLAHQLAPAVRAATLTADLRRSRDALVRSREDERRRLRRDLHDGLGPSLAALTLRVDTARNTVGDDPELDAVLLSLRSQVQEAVADVRRVVEDLRPPALDELGLAGAVGQLAERLSHPGVRIVVRATEPLPPLGAAVEVAAYRVAAEALTNATRHSRGTSCAVELAAEPGSLVVRVTDDGVGFNGSRGRGNGLATMRERAEEVGGTLAVSTSPQGTAVEAVLPIELGGEQQPA